MRRYPHAPLSLSTCPPLRKGAGKWGREHMDGNVDDPGSPRVAATSESSEPGEAVQFSYRVRSQGKEGEAGIRATGNNPGRRLAWLGRFPGRDDGGEDGRGGGTTNGDTFSKPGRLDTLVWDR